jgi:hypothetical protein
MNIIIQTASDITADAGVNYFTSLYGFMPGQFGNQIPLQKANPTTPMITDNHIHGWIRWNDARIPVLQKPADLSNQGEELLTYANETVSYPCAVIRDNEIIISLDIFSHLGLFVSGYMEKIWNNLKDGKEEIIAIPFADYYCDFLFSCIRRAQKAGNPIVHKSFWPDGKTCAVCLTHDVDEVKKTYQWITYPLKQIKRGKPGNIIPQCRSFIQKLKGKEPYWTFDEILRVEGSRGVKSSFYFLKETGKVLLSDRKTWRHLGRKYDLDSPPIRELLHDLHSRGWEVGLHGSFYSYVDPELLRNEKEALEHSLGYPVSGGRQHNLNLKIPETWLNQETAGLVYDTTLGYNDSLGFRWGISFPFRPFFPDEGRNLDILQIPLAIEDLPYFRSSEPFDQLVKIFKNLGCIHGCLTLLWHHSVFNENEFPGWESDYIKILDYCKGCNAWIGCGRQIHEWWTRREETRIEWEYNGALLKIIPYPTGQQHFITVYPPENMRVNDIKNAEMVFGDESTVIIKTHTIDHPEVVEILFMETT